MAEKNFWDISVDRSLTDAVVNTDVVYDVIVIGEGASGLLAAVRAAELGAKVAIIHMTRPGAMLRALPL